MERRSLRRRALALSVLSVLGLAAAGCAGTHVEPVAPLASAAAQGENLAAIQLDRVVFNLERGQQIGSYRGGAWELCGPGLTPTPINWQVGKIEARDEELLDAFYRAMHAMHYNVVGDPDALFGNYSDTRKNIDFLVAGRLDNVTLDVCDGATWQNRRAGKQHGTAAVKVTRQIFSTLDEKVVLETHSEGYAKLEDGIADGEVALILRAFTAAARNLGGDPRFHDVLMRKNVSGQEAVAAPLSGWGPVSVLPAMSVPATAPFNGPIGANMSRIQASVVTVTTGTGFGSGFFVTPDMVLTNHHVVLDAVRVKITLINGMEVYAKTLRSDKKRDVALLRIESGTFTPLPLRKTPVAITEEVYAVGSPLYESLAGTVTRGIVSQIKHDEDGLELIQADANIEHGSSGGPLLDAQGNVVGLSQMGLTDDGDHLVGINFFIPIADALQKLNVVTQ
jgi:serine protease Do